MKKLSVLALFAGILVVAGLFLAKSNLNAQKKLNAPKIEGWFLAGSKPECYNFGLDKVVYKTGSSSAFLESTQKKIDGFGTLMQSFLAKDYLGQRVKMTAYIKSKDVSDWAGMWLRIDPKNGGENMSGFDNMQDRPITGTQEWTKCEIILDVPEESATLNFGVLLSGTGKVWVDSFSFEIVNKMLTETTGGHTYVNKEPTNLDFSK